MLWISIFRRTRNPGYWPRQDDSVLQTSSIQNNKYNPIKTVTLFIDWLNKPLASQFSSQRTAAPTSLSVKLALHPNVTSRSQEKEESKTRLVGGKRVWFRTLMLWWVGIRPSCPPIIIFSKVVGLWVFRYEGPTVVSTTSSYFVMFTSTRTRSRSKVCANATSRVSCSPRSLTSHQTTRLSSQSTQLPLV